MADEKIAEIIKKRQEQMKLKPGALKKIKGKPMGKMPPAMAKGAEELEKKGS